MSTTTRVEVEIGGEIYVLRGDAPAEHIIKVANEVDRRIRELIDRNPRLTLTKAAVLASLNIADELYKLQESYESLVRVIETEGVK
ncbi:MAG: cell division protein ZapA [Bacillota bacterium]